MILVVNLNVSLDKHYDMDTFKVNTVMRAKSVENRAGGKGIHVANVLQILDEEYLLTGMIGGKIGEYIEEQLIEQKHCFDFLPIEGETRSCLAFTSSDGMQTEVLEPGPIVKDEEYQAFLEKYSTLIEKATLVVCSGSVPRNVPKDVYATLIKIARKHDCKVLLDTSGELLKIGINEQPYFIKPNLEELESFCGYKLEKQEDIIKEIKNFLQKGISIVAVSLGAKGSLVGYKDKIYEVKIPKVKAVNPVGSGDSFVAGIAVGLQMNLSIEETLKLASACGTANAMEQESGFVREDIINELLPKLVVNEVV